MSKKSIFKHTFYYSVAIVLAIYLAVLSSTPTTIFWSADEGAKYLQLQTLLAWQGGATYRLAYLGQRLDPTYRFYPHHPIYPQPLPFGQVHFHWPIWFPLLSVIPFKLFGVAGLYLIPLISGVLTAWLSGRLAHRFMPTIAPLTVIVVGLASPIFFYSLLFWEHTFVGLLGLIALWQAMRLAETHGRDKWFTVSLIVILLAAAIALRLEMLFYALALILAIMITSVKKWDSLRIHAFKITGLIIIIVLLLGAIFKLLNLFAEHGLVGPRYIQLVESSLYFATDGNFWRNWPLHLVEIWVNSSASAGPKISMTLVWLGLIGIILGGLVVGSRVGNIQIGLLVGSGLLIGLVSVDVLFLTERYRTIHALFLPAPYLGLMFSYWLYVRQSQRVDAMLLATTTTLYLFFGTFAVMLRQAGILSNLEWGPRYLLTLYPLAIICVMVGMGHIIQATPSTWGKYLLAGVVGILLLIGVGWCFGMSGINPEQYYVVKSKVKKQKIEIVFPLPLIASGFYPFFLSLYFPTPIILVGGGSYQPGYFMGPGIYGDKISLT